MKIAISRPGDAVTGYGRMATEIVHALKHRGIEVTDYDPNDNTPTHLIFTSSPLRPQGWYKHQHVSLLTMWETTQLPHEFIAPLPLFDQLIVPSQQNFELFSKYNPNVTRINLGVNYKEWKYTPRKDGVFTVITGGKGGRRKGIDIAIKVFRRFQAELAKHGYPAARLIIKSDVQLQKPSDDIIVLDESLLAKDEIKLYEQAHVGLYLSRGEGWGMIPHQTIAQGIPTILTDAHGHVGFSHYGIGVKWHHIPAENDIFGTGINGSWWEADEDDALDALLQCFKNYEAHLQVAKFAAELCRKNLTWDATAKQILASLPDNESIISTEWVECPQLKVPLKVNQKTSCTIGGKEFTFQPGFEYQVVPDVRRVIHSAGFLDMSCLDLFEMSKLGTPRTRYIDEGIAA